MSMTCRMANRRKLSSSVAAGVQYHRGGRSKEDTRLVTLLGNRVLRLSQEILSNDESSIADRITAIEGEMRVLKSRGFKVPTANERFGDDGDDLRRELIEAFDHPERVKTYRRWAERRERDERRNMMTLEKMDDKRYFASQASSSR